MNFLSGRAKQVQRCETGDEEATDKGSGDMEAGD